MLLKIASQNFWFVSAKALFATALITLAGAKVSVAAEYSKTFVANVPLLRLTSNDAALRVSTWSRKEIKVEVLEGRGGGLADVSSLEIRDQQQGHSIEFTLKRHLVVICKPTLKQA